MTKKYEAGSALWLPFTQMGEFDRADRTFVRGDGNFLIDARGGRLFDAVSSIWTTIHGHCHPAIVQAVARQAATLDHATLLGATNPVAEDLAKRLAALIGLPKAFFASDGASAVEAALKMALHYWQNKGEPRRTRFVHLRESYHGDTAGAMSVSDIAVFKSRYGAVTFETLSYDDEPPDRGDVAAIIVEPIVQAASGMRVVPAARYARLAGMTPLLIVDEIATGFGRTGSMFAFEQLQLRPDIVCVGKSLTGGALALSATLAADRVFEAFRGTAAEMKHFFHGHSYAGNPIACAAALASLDLFERERTLERAALAAGAIAPALEELAGNSRVREIRGAGLMIGIELEVPAKPVAQRLYERGHFTRPIGNTIQLVPPLSSTAEDLRNFIGNLDELLAADR
jgi:adenosylmethionine-8-amino-7-oxononanoate aminotransferase